LGFFDVFLGKMRKFSLRVGSFNVRGLSSEKKQELLDKDVSAYKVDVVALQETRTKSLEKSKSPGREIPASGTILGRP
jgi:exonuclease III